MDTSQRDFPVKIFFCGVESMKSIRRLLALAMGAVLLLSACSSWKNKADHDSSRLTWGTWGAYGRQEKFLRLLEETYPDIQPEFISYTGGNCTGYSWAQMRADDIPDIFITSQILDQDLAKERLVDLSSYPFINGFSNSILDQVSMDGGIYLLPVSNSMYGIFYNKSLMEEKGWEVPANFQELEVLCHEIQKEGLIPGIVGTKLTGGPFSTVFNLAKTDWLTTPEGVAWEKDFLAGNASAEGMWEGTMDYVQRYMDIGMLHTDPEDRNNPELILDYLGNRKAVFCTAVQLVNITEFPETGDKIGMMPFISRDGSKNTYMYNPTFYFGISKRLTEPGNEKKLEDAIKILSLLYSPEGQATFIDKDTPCVMSVLDSTTVPEDSLIYDAQQALWEGRAFPMTYANWENVLADIGQAYKEWFRGENGMDKTTCIAQMDKLQQGYLNHSDELYFCESTADFTLEETGRLLGKALGSHADVDAVMVPLGEFHEGGVEIREGVTGKLYEGRINVDIVSAICPGYDGEYAVMTMTGAQAKALAQEGFDAVGDGNPFPYMLVTRGDSELEDAKSYQVGFFMKGYTQETAQSYATQIYPDSLRSIVRTWMEEQKTVSPDGNPWE
ncbi:MAG: carbohydrate ABC transporter substrate-binding protein [Lachnospiraceae bacterium]|nr:carbohydrate ABC transporter substrate-binding protein [Lachnospiraceae bacterium]